MAFAPEVTIDALMAMKEKYGDRLYGKYGFKDAVNPSFTFVEAGSTTGPSAGASAGQHDAKAVGKYYKGMATFTVAKGGLMYEASIGGLGGCPFAGHGHARAAGNVCTEDTVHLMQQLGIETGIDLDALIAAGQQISAVLGRPSGSRVAKARSAQ